MNPIATRKWVGRDEAIRKIENRLDALESPPPPQTEPQPVITHEGMVVREGDMIVSHAAINAYTNGIFYDGGGLCRLTEVDVYLHHSIAPNQYGARIAARRIEWYRVDINNAEIIPDTGEASLRLVSAPNGGWIRSSNIFGNRVLIGCGAADEAVDPQPVTGLLIEDCYWAIESTAPDVMSIGNRTTGLVFKDCNFNVHYVDEDNYKRIAALWPNATVKFINCKRLINGEWVPLEKSTRDFKQPDHPGLEVVA
jgi:hypothetical protein